MAGNKGKVFSKRKKQNPTQKSPNTEETKEDRLSSLPDFLIHHIFSFLETKEVVKTSLLAKRWQFLWTGMSELDLREVNDNYPSSRRFVERVGRMLAMCNGFHLNRFAVCFWYEKRFASSVNFWVNFLVKNKVKDIVLRWHEGEEGLMIFYEAVPMYVLPQVLYLHSYLTSLNISYCEMDPRGVIDWKSLKLLEMENIELTDSVMEKILSGCPVLEDLYVGDVRRGTLTYLNVSSPSLTKLHINHALTYDNFELEPLFEISAPLIHVLIIECHVRGVQFKLRNISSLIQAEIYFSSADNDLDREMYGSPWTMNYMKELLSSLHSVKILRLGPSCTEILSLLEFKGWKAPSSTRMSLEIRGVWHEGIVLGLLSMLKSSPKLKTLLIEGLSCPNDEEFIITQDQVATYLQDHTLELVMSHLKTIEITDFSNEFLLSETMLILLKLLLKSSTVLEKLVIHEESVESSSPGDSTCQNVLSSSFESIHQVIFLD